MFQKLHEMGGGCPIEENERLQTAVKELEGIDGRVTDLPTLPKYK